MFKKQTVIVLVLLSLILMLVSCQREPQVLEVTRVVTETEVVEVPGEDIVVTRIVEVEVPVEPDVVESPAGQLAEVYRIGIFEDPATVNYWNYLGPGSSVWSAYVLVGQQAQLYTFSDQRFDFVPSLAKDLPPEPVQEGDFWTITVEIIDDAHWSDGEPVTAHDVAFTFSACLDLRLTQNWVSTCFPNVLDRVEALDDHTVKFYFTAVPGLSQWQYGAAMGPVLPEHYWGDAVANAQAAVAGLGDSPAHPDEVEDCDADELAAGDQAICDAYLDELAAYNEAFVEARAILYEASATNVPSFGGFTTDRFEPGAFVQRTANAGYYFKDAEFVQYDDGTYLVELADGRTVQLYGNATGEETLRFTEGPYNPNIIFSIYGDQSAAFLALSTGEVDYVLNPLALSRGLREQAERGEGIVTYVNPANSLFYLAFNMRKEPYSRPEFRQAVDILIDKEFVATSVLQGAVIPAPSVVPPGNAFWYNDEIETPYSGLTRSERLELAIQVLEEAGWTWEARPQWDPDDPDAQDLIPGRGVRMPNGELMPQTTILGPGPAYDPQRAVFNQWTSEWMRELGMPVQSELAGFNTILGPVFIDASFDMYILGWTLTLFPDYVCDFFHSKNDTLVSGGFNTPGLADPEYDTLCDAFESETDLMQAQEQVRELQIKLAELRPYIPLFYIQETDLIRNTVVLPYTESLGGLTDLAGLQTSSQVLTAR